MRHAIQRGESLSISPRARSVLGSRRPFPARCLPVATAAPTRAELTHLSTPLGDSSSAIVPAREAGSGLAYDSERVVRMSTHLNVVSIVIPCFRHGRLLDHAIRSALAQTYPAIEVIVVNDGSDDNTDDIAKAFGSSIAYVAKENGGLSSARNAGIDRATGQFLLFLDADDLLHPDAVARLVAAAGPDSRTLVMMGVRYFLDHTDDTTGPTVLPQYGRTLAPTIFVRNHPVHGILCPKSAVVAAGGFDETLRAVEDWDLWIRVAMSGIGVVTIPWCGGFYRQLAGSMSSDRSRMARAKCRMFAKAWNSLREENIFWKSWSGAFLRSLYAVRRNCKLLGLGDELPHIQAMIDEMRRRGIRVEPASPAALRLQDAAPGSVGDFFEAAGLALARVCLPSFYDSCKN